MKTHQKLSMLVVTVLLLLSINNAKAQLTMPFINNLPCDVIVGFEAWDGTCFVCNNGPITIPANSAVNVAICCASCGVCIYLQDIGGTPITGNHSNPTFNCHPSGLNNMSGTLPGNCNQNGTTYQITHTLTSWVIQ